MSPLRLTYLALSIIGLLPWVYFYAWFQANGWNLGPMIDAWHVNDATTGLVYDLTIAAIALTVFIIAECLARRDYLGLIAVPGIYMIGVSFGLPFYLFLRSRPLD